MKTLIPMHPAIRIAVAALALVACQAVTAAPVEGKDYFTISPQQPTSDPSKIVVTEFFSYQCPHCYAFSQPFAAWSRHLPPDVTAERVAVSIGHSTWVPMAQAYYALKAMNAVPKLDEQIFAAIHRQGAKLVDEPSITAWMGKLGVNQADFAKAYRSFSVQLSTRRADDLSRSHRLPSVPVLVIDGKFMVRISDNGKFAEQLEVANYLIDKARKLRPAQGRGR